MTGTSIQYLLGIYFIVVAVTFENGRLSADAWKLIAGIVLFITAVLGLTVLK